MSYVLSPPAYLDARRRIDELLAEPAQWTSKAVLNVTRIGRFSSDRAVAEYARDIWGISSIR